MGESKRFEEWDEVECNECARYWDSSCDGAAKDTKRPCNSYLATRSIILPAKIQKLERRLEWLEWGIGLIIALLAITFLVVCLIG